MERKEEQELMNKLEIERNKVTYEGYLKNLELLIEIAKKHNITKRITVGNISFELTLNK